MQIEHFGNGYLRKLNSIVKECSPSKIFLITGEKSFELSGAANGIKSALKGIESYRYSGFEENPKFKELLYGANILRDFNPDLIIAAGGGSVIDTAKIITILPRDQEDAKKIIRGEHSNFTKIAPIVAIPTTSGSGSEATHFAVAYLKNKKYSVAHADLLPDYSIIDPELTYSMPPYQTAVSGLDALSQAIESGWANGATAESKNYSYEAIDLISANIARTVHDPSPKSRYEMAKGSNLAGKAINISKTTAPHAMSYGFTAKYGIPHGHAVALTLGHFFTLNKKVSVVDNNAELSNYIDFLVQKFNAKDVEDATKRFYELVEGLGLDLTLSKIGLKDERELIELANSVNVERLKNHPVKIEKNMILEILNIIK